MVFDHVPTCFVYNSTIITENVASLRSHLPGVRLLYSIKCNPFPALVAHLHSLGLGMDAASSGEVALAKQIGCSKEEIFYSAPGKSEEDIAYTLDSCVLVADSLTELSRINALARQKDCCVAVGVRINPLLALMPSAFGAIENHGMPCKFGIDEEQFFASCDFLQSLSSLQIIGLHIYLRSQIINEQALIDIAEYGFLLLHRMQSLLGKKLSFLNIGGGFGISTPTWPALSFNRLKERLNQHLPRLSGVCVYAESGRYLVSQAGTYYTRIEDIKISRGSIFYITAGTLQGFLRPSIAELTKTQFKQKDLWPCEPLFSSNDCHQITLVPGKASTKRSPKRIPVTVVGNLCTAADCIASNILLPMAEIGDYIAVSNAGAYGYTLSPLAFSSHRPPQEFFL